MNDIQMSVIIPVYNTSKYLKRCIESVIVQKNVELEIIIIDDGSTDDSFDICKTYADAYERIKLIHQENSGLSAARNKGIDNACGQYILFLDSDDFYEKDNTIISLLNEAEKQNADVVCFGYKRYFESGNRFTRLQAGFSGCAGNILALIKQNTYQSSATIKLIKKQLISENDIRFENGVFSEDIIFSAKLLLYSAAVAYCSTAVYIYRVREGSITKNIGPKMVCDLLHAIVVCEKLFNDSNHKSLQYAGLCYTAFQYATLLVNSELSRPHPSHEVMEAIREKDTLLAFDLCPIVKTIKIFHKIFGFNFTRKALFIYFKLFRY